MEQNTPSVRLLDFIRSSPSCYHAIDNIRRKLIEKGYIELSEGEDWSVEVGGKYFVARNSSSIIAFRIPERVVGGFMVVASHSDSPTFRVKPNPELSGPENYVRLNTERYGGMILDSWFDRPLSVAGRIMVRENGRIVEKLVSVDDDLLIIPHVAIHMLKSNDGIVYNPAQDLVPLFGLAGPDEKPQGSLMKIVAEAAGVDQDNILSHDLFLVNRQRQSVWGRSKEFISSPKLDDLQCAFSAFEAFTDSESDNLTNSGHSIPVMFVADNEEVGSATMQGAGSTFLADTLLRVTSALEVCGAKCDCFGAYCTNSAGNSIAAYRRMLASSMLLSADNAHAVHPNHPELADPTHRPRINGGVVIKYNAAQLYTTDSYSSAIFLEMCKKVGVPTQMFCNRSDIRGGSTLGSISNTKVPLHAVDIGVAQLAMHSSYETCGAFDTGYMINAMKEFFSSSLLVKNGSVEIV